MAFSDYTVVIDGNESSMLDQYDPLIRAVLISLFTWRRATADDITEGQSMGWWGDVAEPTVVNDQIGSRLWLLTRVSITQAVLNKAYEYCVEALQWMVEDGVASRYTVTVERMEVEAVAIWIVIYRKDGSSLSLKFDDAWEIVRAV